MQLFDGFLTIDISIAQIIQQANRVERVFVLFQLFQKL